uniref:Uncharacterized protein LOC114324762 n=1 Tax=Diabrotica virgifera virgifera TaxID=50390 RepID=A0A6P7EZH1_DIAVI
MRKVIQDNGNTNYVKTGTVIVTFKGQSIPKNVIIEKMIFEVENYTPRIIQCLKCLRFGHISAQCRGKDRCERCGEEHHKSNCSNPNNLLCALCKRKHSDTDKEADCTDRQKQEYIKKL